MAISLDWVTRVRNHLIAADVNGLTFKQLLVKVRSPVHPAGDLRTVLNAWRKRKWVDNYEVPSRHGSPSQVWRATQLLIDEWPNALYASSLLSTKDEIAEVIAGSAEPWVSNRRGTKTDDQEETHPASATPS